MGHYEAFYETMNFPENQVESLEMGLKRVRDSYKKPKSKHLLLILVGQRQISRHEIPFGQDFHDVHVYINFFRGAVCFYFRLGTA